MKVSPHPLRRRSATLRAVAALLALLAGTGALNQPLFAGDILRGGATTGAPVGATSPTGTAPPTISQTAGGGTRDSLARTAQAIQAMQAIQTAARNVANQSGANHAIKNPSSGGQLINVPDGLGKGGLQVSSGVTGNTSDPLWSGANLPTQKDGTNEVTIKQTAQQAVLNWETFNVGKNTTLNFDQSLGGANAGQWIAFNKVNDPMANPSQILGTIKAQGQVYVINRNGIVFGGASQVNVHALVASTLSINDNLVKQGLLNNPNNEFLFSGLGGDPNTKVGDVIVEAGAQLTAPTSAEKVGGRIALIGANVVNDGTISTTDGQTILAAGLQVGWAAHATSDPSLRGLDTFVGKVVDPSSTLTGYAGTVTNNGIIDAGRANVTMVGKDVQQLGAITSTTSVSFNGRIDLLANYDALSNPGANPASNQPNFVNNSTGSVTLGQGSVTQILPELDSKDTVIGSALTLRSQINIQGQQVHFEGDSTLYAPNAIVNVDAGTWNSGTPSGSGSVITEFFHSGGQINVDNGALIDVSGSKNVQSSVTSNIVAVELRGDELADSPLLRDGALRGQTIYIDVTKTGVYNGKTWVGTPLADVSGYVNLIQRTVGELTAAGGSVSMNAGGAVVIRNGATVDVSGGTINYAGGVVQTSRVIAGKQIFDVADATPDRVYDGVYRGGSITKSKAWGVTEQYTNPLTLNGTRYQEGFTQGGNGGSLKITGGSVAVDGSLKGSTYTGVRQRAIGPVASSLSISLVSERLVQGSVSPYSPNATDVVFSNTNTQAPLGDYAEDSNGNPLELPQERIDKLILSPELLGDNGFGNVSVRTPNGDISVEQGVTLQTTPRGSISFAAANIDIQGSLISAGGTLSFTTYNISPEKAIDLQLANNGLPATEPNRGQFTLGANATLSTAGYLVDDRPTSSTLLQTPMVTNGGTVTVNSLSADLAAGSKIDVSGGVVATGSGKYTYGNGGSISLLSGNDPGLSGVSGGHLTLAGQLLGMSGAKGGSLTVQAGRVQIGGDSSSDTTLHLSSDFFNQGGFSSFAIRGLDSSGSSPAMLITSGTQIAPVVQSWLASEVDGSISLSTYVQPTGLRAPVSLTFDAPGVINALDNHLIGRGDLVVQAGARIDAGPAGSITLSGQTNEVHGSLLAAGGSISIKGSGSYPLLDGVTSTAALTTVLIGSDAVLDASGTVLLVPDSFGRQRGAVLGGGSISIEGNTVAEKGALLDVSGASGTLDLLPGESGQSLADLAYGASGTTSRPYNIRGKATKVDSSGGSIKLTGSQMLLTDATLVGKAGGSTAAGGTLNVSSGAFIVSGATLPQNPNIVLTQSGPVISSTYTAGIGKETQADGSGVSGGGRFAIDSFTSGGFDNLDIGGVVKAIGPVAIKADGRVTLGTGPVLYADSTLSVDASYVKIGAPFKNPRQSQENQDDYIVNNPGSTIIRMPATHGTGTLSVSGDLIDVGDLSLQGIGTANLVANNGDIRGSGTLAIAGDLSLTAGQIYPPTALQFTLAAFDYQSGGTTHAGSVTISGSGKRSLPLSAGGTLAVYASNIVQNGTLRAPFGNIILGWDGTGTAPFDRLTGANAPKTASLTLGAKSVTSVSAIDPITGKALTMAYGTSVDGTTWLDPAGKDITNGGLPQKSITLSGDSVVSEKGSQVDIRGGGDLFAYRFVAGNGGSTDILASSTSFAIIPGYSADYAPYAPFSSTATAALGGDAGYVNSSLQVGQQVYLDGSTGVPAGIYTLLPARYALLPGAYLVTPKSGTAVGTRLQADGSRIVSGYLLNGLDDSVDPTAVRTRFEVASAKVVNSRAEYTPFLANSFLTSTGGFRLPGDSGQLVLSATKAMAIGGQVLSAASGDFRGGLIDISSAGDILITNGAPATSPANTLVIDVNLLSGFGAESLLIGGIRSASTDGTQVTVTTGNVTLDNAGVALTGPEIILAAKQGVTLAAGAQIKQNGRVTSDADTLIIGNTLASGATPTGSGNGALVRVNHGDSGSLIRRDVIVGQGNASVSIGSGASLQGDSVTLDSTGNTSIGAGANLAADNLSLSSGRISLGLDPAVTPGADAGLVLSSEIIRELASSSSLSLSSYSSIDLLGAGVVGGVNGAGKPAINSLSLHAAAIRGIGVGSGTVEFDADQIEIGGLSGAVAPSGPAESSGLLTFRSSNLHLGSGAVDLRGFNQVDMTASKEVRTTGNGSLSATGGLTLNSPLLTSDAAVKYAVTSTGALKVTGSGSTGAVTTAGLASSLSLTGSSVDIGTRIVLPSGVISATATSGDLNITGSLEAKGIAQRFKGQTRYTNAGAINLTSSAGSITLGDKGSLDVSAAAGGGDAGSLSVSAKSGSFNLIGAINGKGGASGDNGQFALQVSSLPKVSVYDAVLDAASFTGSREYRVTTGDVEVDGTAHAHSYTISTDSGAITVTGTIDASGKEGGTVRLVANTDLTLAKGSLIDASADDFSSAGKGGSVTLETRGGSKGSGLGNGTITLANGSSIDLSVATDKGADSAKAGDFTGTLHLRAPQISNGTDIAVSSLNSTVIGASSVIVEGYTTYDLSNTTGTITTAVQNQVKTDATAFMTNADAIEARILGAGSTLGALTTVRPGAEIINTKGDLTLGSASSTSTSDWNLSTFRFGGEQVPGILTLRAAGNLVFYNTLSDGFTSTTYTSGLIANNAALSDNAESWSFRLVSGADFSAADTRKVIPVTVADDAALGSASGSLKLGKDAGFYASTRGGAALTSDAANKYFQVIRTGSGDIDVVAGGDVQLLNQLASIYTAGTQTSDPTLGSTFSTPITRFLGNLGAGLGSVQQATQSPVQFTLGGGDVDVTAGNDIIHLTLYADPNTGVTGYVQDSQREMPVNWLYRRGYVNPATGQFGATRNGDIGSTAWWVDFTNFFDGVAALGGGNVTLTAGRDVSNVDASTPTNARMPSGTPDASKLVELGGGNLTVTAGRDINAGVYYVERGLGSLTAGGSIVTNATRAPVTGGVTPSDTALLDPATWLPTTLFVGKSSFEVTAGKDALMGPMANVFLLPQGLNNSPYDKTWFSTYSQDAGVSIAAYSGDATLRQAVTLSGDASSPILMTWFETQLMFDASTVSSSYFQPWLRLTETMVSPFEYAFSLMPGTLKMTSFGGDVNLTGKIDLSPSANGTLEILAAKGINGLLVTGISNLGNRSWTSAQINLSDADPAALPGITNPFAYQELVGTTNSGSLTTQSDFLQRYADLFNETGSTDGALQQRQVHHSLIPNADGDGGHLLHSGDTNPVRLYSDSGDISGLTLFSAKFAEILAGQDLRDISFYLQNVRSTDVSIVAASRDIIAYDLSTSQRIESQAAGNQLSSSGLKPVGDIQISGEGSLEVFAGRNLDLGIGQTTSDGLGSGITSVGNGRNPYLTFAGAEIITAAGFDATSLTGSKADFAAFITKFVNTDDGATHLKELGLTPDQFAALTTDEEKNEVALKVFFLVLRDTGRHHNDPESDHFGSYDEGQQAVATLFPGTEWKGNIDTRSRSIRTRNGGDITIFAPGGDLRLAQSVIGNPLVPPGIITEAGGNISIATDGDVSLGISRIFTLRGGNEIIWSTHGDIAAGSSSKTVQSAPPTRVLIDPQSGDVKTDLAGLATGGGIGVLSTVAGVKPADVDLIAPEGTIDAGDAGIRFTGNITLAAPVVANAGNISGSGSVSGVSSGPAAPSVAALTAASSAAVASTASQNNTPQQNTTPETQPAIVDTPSDISVEVIGYGGDDEDTNVSAATTSEEEDEKRKRRQRQEQEQQDQQQPEPNTPPAQDGH